MRNLTSEISLAERWLLRCTNQYIIKWREFHQVEKPRLLPRTLDGQRSSRRFLEHLVHRRNCCIFCGRWPRSNRKYREREIISSNIIYILDWLQQNQLLQTLFFGSVETSTYFVIHKFYQLVVKKLYSYFRCEVTIHNVDPSYNAVIDYVTEKFLKE